MKEYWFKNRTLLHTDTQSLSPSTIVFKPESAANTCTVSFFYRIFFDSQVKTPSRTWILYTQTPLALWNQLSTASCILWGQERTPLTLFMSGVCNHKCSFTQITSIQWIFIVIGDGQTPVLPRLHHFRT